MVFLRHGSGTNLDAFSLNVELTAQTEELHQGGAGGSHRIARGNGRLGLHVQNELVEISALFHTGGFDLVAHLEHRGVDRIDRNTADLVGILLVHLRGDVATATLDGELDLEFAVVGEGSDVLIRVGDGDAGRRGDVARGGFALAALAQIHDNRLIVFAGQHDALDVQQDLGDVFQTPGRVVNSCRAPEIRTEVTAAPGIELSRVRRSELPSV